MESIFIPRYFWNGTNDEVCTNTAVLVRDNRIEQIDEPEKLRLGYPEAQVLESKDWLMMPAFVDAHDHGRGMSPISFRTPDRALEMWLQDLNKLPAIPHYQACYYDGMRLVSSGVGMVLHSHNPNSFDIRTQVYEAFSVLCIWIRISAFIMTVINSFQICQNHCAQALRPAFMTRL